MKDLNNGGALSRLWEAGVRITFIAFEVGMSIMYVIVEACRVLVSRCWCWPENCGDSLREIFARAATLGAIRESQIAVGKNPIRLGFTSSEQRDRRNNPRPVYTHVIETLSRTLFYLLFSFSLRYYQSRRKSRLKRSRLKIAVNYKARVWWEM